MHSQESRAKISRALKGRKLPKSSISKLRANMLNRKVTEQTRERMRVSHSKSVCVTNIESGLVIK